VVHSIIYCMFPVEGLEDNNNSVVIVKEFRSRTIIHEHDFITIRTGKETSIICLTCGSFYCKRCGKLVTISDKSYMQNNIYN
jgi:hypothetical protein